MSKRTRYSAKEKVQILREHLENQVPVSEICQRYAIHANMFYKWKKQLFEGALNTFAGEHTNGKGALERKNEQLKGKLSDMREVISWLTEENLKLRKNEFGEI
jgi:transposase-like protein